MATVIYITTDTTISSFNDNIINIIYKPYSGSTKQKWDLKLGILLIFEHMNETLCAQMFIHKVYSNINNVFNFKSLTFVPTFLSLYIFPVHRLTHVGTHALGAFPPVVGIVEDPFHLVLSFLLYSYSLGGTFRSITGGLMHSYSLAKLYRWTLLF